MAQAKLTANAIMKRIQNLSTAIGRMGLSARLGKQYGGDRNLYKALGYKDDPQYEDFLARYERQDIAQAVIDRPIDAMWRNGVEVVESDDADETDFEKAWIELEDRLGLVQIFRRLDRLTSIGRYGVLLYGFTDVANVEQFQRPIQEEGERELLYVRPLGEGSAKIERFEKDTRNPRFGMPLIYKVILKEPGEDKTQNILVHHTRVLHVTKNLLEDDVIGRSDLEVILNRLYDLEKLVGGSAEMFWRGARPGYQAKVEDDYQITQAMQDDLQDQLDEFEHNLRRILVNEGIQFEALEAQMGDPSSHVDVQLKMISAVTGIPLRVLSGSERGELASTQDQDAWNDHIGSRQQDVGELRIVRPFVDAMIELNVLPAPGEDGYQVLWDDLHTESDEEKAAVGKTRTEALAAYAGALMAGVEEIVPREAFLEFFLGLDEDQRERIEALLDEMAESEDEEDKDAIIAELEAQLAQMRGGPGAPSGGGGEQPPAV